MITWDFEWACASEKKVIELESNLKRAEDELELGSVNHRGCSSPVDRPAIGKKKLLHSQILSGELVRLVLRDIVNDVLGLLVLVSDLLELRVMLSDLDTLMLLDAAWEVLREPLRVFDED